MQNIVGHENVKERFAKAVSRDRLPSTFLFVGPSGIGKRTFAYELANCLLCESIDESELRHCGSCESCKLFAAGNHPDFGFVEKNKDRAFLQIEQFIGDREHRNRAGLCHNISMTPFRGGRKIAIIDDADFFNQESANCLLKTLEEPPPRSIMIMIGTSEQKQISTIRSRSQIVHFQPLTIQEVASVMSRLDLGDQSSDIDSLAARSNGSLDVLKLAQEEGLFDFREMFLRKLATFEPMTKGFPKELSGFVDQAGTEPARRRDRVRQFADFAIEFYHALGRVMIDPMVIDELPDSVLRNAVQSAVGRIRSDVEHVSDCVDRCLDVHLQVAANANQTTLLESWLSDLGKLSRGDEMYSQIRAAFSY